MVGSNELIEWGTKLEILRKEKNDNKYAALKIWPMYVLSHCLTMADKRGISITALSETFKGAESVVAFVKYFMRGSLKSFVPRPHMAHLVLMADM